MFYPLLLDSARCSLARFTSTFAHNHGNGIQDSVPASEDRLLSTSPGVIALFRFPLSLFPLGLDIDRLLDSNILRRGTYVQNEVT